MISPTVFEDAALGRVVWAPDGECWWAEVELGTDQPVQVCLISHDGSQAPVSEILTKVHGLLATIAINEPGLRGQTAETLSRLWKRSGNVAHECLASADELRGVLRLTMIRFWTHGDRPAELFFDDCSKRIVERGVVAHLDTTGRSVEGIELPG